MQPVKHLPQSFYLRDDVVVIARELIGKKLVTFFNGEKTSGIITETEAYAGITDKASHAFGGRLTNRTSVMFQSGGTAYVYLCYGMHSLFNVVTNVAGIPDAVLIRAIKPLEGIDLMLQRTGKQRVDKKFGIGPGKVSRCLGIHFSHSGLPLTPFKNGFSVDFQGIWIEESEFDVKQNDICTGPRIGVDYAGKDALLPYRFMLK